MISTGKVLASGILATGLLLGGAAFAQQSGSVGTTSGPAAQQSGSQANSGTVAGNPTTKGSKAVAAKPGTEAGAAPKAASQSSPNKAPVLGNSTGPATEGTSAMKGTEAGPAPKAGGPGASSTQGSSR